MKITDDQLINDVKNDKGTSTLPEDVSGEQSITSNRLRG